MRVLEFWEHIVRVFIYSVLLIFASMLPACGAKSVGDWQLDGLQSQLEFSTTKNKTIDETHHFKTISGQLEDDGVVRVVVDLNSVDTNIAKRDERMRKYLFETDKYPTMTITTKINTKAYKKLEVGTQREHTIPTTIDLHGVKLDQNVLVNITRKSESEFLIESSVPVVVSASEFGFEHGVEKLKTLAGLNSIKPDVAVSFKLVFKRV